MNKNSRQILIAIVTFLSGLYFFMEWLLPAKVGGFEFGFYHEDISNAFVTIGAMAIGLGLINILRVHGGAIVKGRKGMLNSLALLLGILLMFFVKGGDFLTSLDKVNSWNRISNLNEYSKDILLKRESKDPSKRLDYQIKLIDKIKTETSNPDSYLFTQNIKDENLLSKFNNSLSLLKAKTISLKQAYLLNRSQADLEKMHLDLEKTISLTAASSSEVAEDNYLGKTFLKVTRLLEYGFFFPLGAAMFSLLAFYISVAAYRSFRIKSIEAMVMMIFAILVMLGQIPQGPLYIWEGLPALRLWLMANISTPAVRAIEFGSIVAGLAMAVRMWLSLEKSPLAVDEGGS